MIQFNKHKTIAYFANNEKKPRTQTGFRSQYMQELALEEMTEKMWGKEIGKDKIGLKRSIRMNDPFLVISFTPS